ncbi:hypothetical protein IV203_008643 [Nitzschia inconspicua]|uniref:Uncharacterized protein n=1 Tax=Nitzschia inconspicua TaxID=303405 RepID=A0A9K3KYW4_9STRA|nr:hypothetical protein IV203_008643 [Nitzschia inconspicua]
MCALVAIDPSMALNGFRNRNNHHCCGCCRSSFRPLCTTPSFSLQLSRAEPNDDAHDEEESLYDTGTSSLNLKTFQRRRDKLRLQTRQRQWQQPPNPLLDDPTDFVQALLQALQQTSPLHGGGALVLLQSSTESWRQTILKSIGAPLDGTNEQVAPTLQAALERDDNQFAILVDKNLHYQTHNTDSNNDNRTGNTVVKWYFPSDVLDFQDGTCWVESRLRTVPDDQLWVAAGWSLRQRTSDGAWLLDGVDWQDFRDDFRPGIGREEWERICG